MNITCLFRTWPYSCIWLRNTVYNTKQSDGEDPVTLELKSTLFIAIAPRSALARSGST